MIDVGDSVIVWAPGSYLGNVGRVVSRRYVEAFGLTGIVCGVVFAHDPAPDFPVYFKLQQLERTDP